MSDIISKIESYLQYKKEVFGDTLYLNEDFDKIQIKNDTELSSDSQDNYLKQNNKIYTKQNSQLSDDLNKGMNTKIHKNDISESENSEINVKNINIKNNTVSIDKSWESSTSLSELQNKISNCTECPLGHTRNKLVFGSGNPNADILIIGEGPGAEEDLTGLPFVGRAGQLLTKILDSIELSRDDVYIANIVKCRPPANRRPESFEVEKCERYLKRQIELIKPTFILALGLTAIETLFKQKFKMGDIRGKLLEYHGIKTLATYHPAALLRNPNFKRGTWEDVKLLKKLYIESKEIKL